MTQGRAGFVQAGAFLTGTDAHQSGPPPLMEGLTQDQIVTVLETAGTPRVLNRGSTLFEQASPSNGIYFIESGCIRVFYTAPTQREITLAYWHPGNFVGGPEVFGNGVHVWSGVATVDSSVLHLPGAMLRRLIETIPQLGINVIEGLAFKGKCYSGLAQLLGTRSATERLAHLLLHLADLYGVEERGGILIAASFTHADIANMIGATRQWITMNFRRFIQSGVIEMHRSNIVLLDARRLRAIRDGRSE